MTVQQQHRREIKQVPASPHNAPPRLQGLFEATRRKKRDAAFLKGSLFYNLGATRPPPRNAKDAFGLS